MAKVGGTLKTLLGGVSTAPRSIRPDISHEVMDNFLVDPVRGLVMRPGTVFKATTDFTLTESIGDVESHFQRWGDLRFSQDGKDYLLAYSKQEHLAAADRPSAVLYCITDNTFLPVEYVGDYPEDPVPGFSTAVHTGSFLVMPQNGVAPGYTETAKWKEGNTDGYGVVWCSAGAYSTTYTLIATFYEESTDTTHQFSSSYATPSSTYPYPLDTSGVLASDPEYTKKVTDLQSDYTTNVANWAVDAANDIRPYVIVSTLLVNLYSAYNPTIGDALVVIYDGGVAKASPTTGSTWRLVSWKVVASGNAAGIVAYTNGVESVDNLAPAAPAGMVVKVSPRGGASFYMEAIQAADPSSGLPTTTWRECAGVTVATSSLAYFGQIDTGTLYLSTDPTALPVPLPSVATSVSGDSYIPRCFSHAITAAFIHQNRLVLCADGHITASRPRDYLNFFPESALDIKPDDPVEVRVNSRMTDSLKHIAEFDRNVLLFGEKGTYYLDGAQVLTPTNLPISVMARYDDLADATPVQLLGGLYFAQSKYGQSAVHRLVPGNFEGSLQTVPASEDIPGYMVGSAKQLMASSYSSTLLLRTDGLPYGLYYGKVLGERSGKPVVSWGRFTWSQYMGICLSVTAADDGALLLFVRDTPLGTGFAVDTLQLTYSPGSYGGVDSVRPATVDYWHDVDSYVYVPMGSGDMQGSYMDFAEWRDADPAIDWPDPVVGMAYRADLTLTSPHHLTRENEIIKQGSLVVGNVTVHTTDTAGFTWEVTSLRNNNVLATASPVQVAIAGQYSQTNHSTRVPIGRDRDSYQLTISSLGPLPVTISHVEWEGQLFSYRR